MPSLAAVAAQLCNSHTPVRQVDGVGDPAAAVWAAAGDVLDRYLCRCPPEAGAELLRVLAEGAVALQIAEPAAVAACPTPLFGEASGRLRRVHSGMCSPLPAPRDDLSAGGSVLTGDPVEEAETLRRVALKRRHNDALEECLRELRRALAEEPDLGRAPTRSEALPSPAAGSAAGGGSDAAPTRRFLNVTVTVQLRGADEEYNIRVKTLPGVAALAQPPPSDRSIS
eukprot:TRINITY_DN29068_c0_g1_i2.p1 TRINITY_DN29068_c0_g1~~TRINITY_DN29068_c0_g1_i2.p1  ORF type:complete len:243 (+),score=86.44 TRINITY_DN29068_c0_g1_i2:54-731(+)